MIVRVCVKCKRTFDAMNGDSRVLCQCCSDELGKCNSLTRTDVFLKDVRASCEEDGVPKKKESQQHTKRQKEKAQHKTKEKTITNIFFSTPSHNVRNKPAARKPKAIDQGLTDSLIPLANLDNFCETKQSWY